MDNRRIVVLYQGKTIELEKSLTVKQLLKELRLNPLEHLVQVDGKPTFVENVYSVTYVCTRSASSTVVNLPMIIVQDKGYYFATWIQETGGATELKYYPTFVPFL